MQNTQSFTSRALAAISRVLWRDDDTIVFLKPIRPTRLANQGLQLGSKKRVLEN